MNQNLNREMLEELQKACDTMTKLYQKETENKRIKFNMLQSLVRSCPKCN